MASIKSSFNTIGAEGIHESLGNHVANTVGANINQELMSKLKINELFPSSNGWRIISKSNMASNLGLRGTKMSGEQQKDDIKIFWSDGTYTIALPVSMKARYSEENYDIKNPGGPLKGEIRPQGISLGELLDMSYKTTSVFEQAWSTWLSGRFGYQTTYVWDYKNIRYPYLVQSWNEFKRMSKYTALFRSLVGTVNNDDFAALLIVNSTIFSIYDILEQADNSEIVYWSNKYGSSGEPPDFIDIANDVSATIKSLNSTFLLSIKDEMRDASVQETIRSWYKKKYSIAINLTGLQSVL